MKRPNMTYDQLHQSNAWAYGDRPDQHLADAVAAVAPGAAVDLGGGQGRHALYLASLGFDVELVDLSHEALAQAGRAAAGCGLALRTVHSNIGFYEPRSRLQVVVAALALHVPARHASLKAARLLGVAMNPGALFYVSLPGFDEGTRALAEEVMEAAGCEGEAQKHVVTRTERPRLPVPRRNETRAVGYRR